MKVKNTLRAARQLAKHFIKEKTIPVFDLDGVLFDASHRQVCNPDGTLNLAEYRKNSTAKKIALDRNLPLIRAVKMLNEAGVKYHVCTARVACKHTRKLLADREIKPASIMARNGDGDTRRDFELKGSHFLKSFSTRQRKKMVLIDDNAKNCETARACGMQSIHVPFEGH